MNKLCRLCILAIVLHVSASSPNMLDPRQDTSWQSTSGVQFTNSAAQDSDYDPHDFVPAHYTTIRIAHAALMSAVWLVMFPIGAVIIRAMNDPWLVWVHAAIQMLAFWIFVVAAGMGIWMAKEIDSLHRFHPLIGIHLLALLILQPATEILNHRLYHRHPKVIITAHIHLWLGRVLLAAGVVQGGLGFVFAASFPKAVVEMWPRIAYGGLAVFAYLMYLAVGVIYPEVRGIKAAKNGTLENTRPGQGHIRLQKVRTEAVEAGRTEDLRIAGNTDGNAGVGTGMDVRVDQSIWPAAGYAPAPKFLRAWRHV